MPVAYFRIRSLAAGAMSNPRYSEELKICLFQSGGGQKISGYFRPSLGKSPAVAECFASMGNLGPRHATGPPNAIRCSPLHAKLDLCPSVLSRAYVPVMRLGPRRSLVDRFLFLSPAELQLAAKRGLYRSLQLSASRHSHYLFSRRMRDRAG